MRRLRHYQEFQKAVKKGKEENIHEKGNKFYDEVFSGKANVKQATITQVQQQKSNAGVIIHKPDTYKKAKQTFEKKQQLEEERQKQLDEKKQKENDMRQQALKTRKLETSQLKQRSKRGQPIMKFRIAKILSKINGGN